MLTGYEQVRSVVAAIAGDQAAADNVHLVLPETGVCTTDLAIPNAGAASGCCGGPAPAETGACCVRDAEARAETGRGCGCSSVEMPKEAEKGLVAAGCC